MDYFFQEQRWTDTFLSLHVKKFKRIILFLLIAFSAAGAKAQSVKFNDYVRYSQWVIDSRLGDFYGNTNDFGFTTYNRDLTVKKNVTKWKNGSTNPYIDYVPGLVAKATIEAAEYYKNFDWAKPWFKSVEWYGNKCTVPTSPDNLDAINASKMYFGIYALANGSFSSNAESTTASTATTQLGNALSALKHYNKTYAFPASTTLNGKDIAGGWYHKSSYSKQMWLDGQYMGPALLAQLINGYLSYSAISDNDWDLIAKQFTIVWEQCWDDKEKLLYHAFSSEPLSYWTSDAEIWTTAQADKTKWTSMDAAGHSSSFWGRAEGWYFLALVDVLEQMPTTNNNYNTLKSYLTTLADGIKARQDATSGCWYQLVGKDGSYTASYYNGNSANPKTNYLESSCTAIFAAAYLKAVRLGLLSNDYKTIGENAYKGAVAQFMKQRTDGTVDLLGCCKSAGVGTAALGEEKFRDGSNAYYLHGYDVAPTSTTSNYYTEGKVMGAFIMAATEYEIANPKTIRFSYDLAPTYDLAQGGSIKAEALGSGTITYQWFNASDNSLVFDGQTFTPTKTGSYYCKATNGSTTIQTSTTEVTVSETVTPSGPVVWTFTKETLTGTLGTAGTQVKFTSTDGSSNVMTYVSGSKDEIKSLTTTISDVEYSSYLRENGTGSVDGNRRMEFNAPSSKGTVTIVYAGTAGTTKVIDGSNGNKELATLTGQTNKDVTTDVLTTTVGNKIIIFCPKKSYIYSVIWTPINEPTGPSISISTQPQSADYVKGATVVTPLSVGVTFNNAAADEYNKSYLWYKNTVNSTTGGVEVGREATYTPTLSSTAGTTYYYYCVVKATLKTDVSKTLTATSDVAAITVSEPYVKFTKQPSGAQYSIGATATPLSVEATTNISEATISYQWYSNDSESTNDGTPVGTGTSYTPSTEMTGTTYYYCVATARKDGSEPLTATSSIVSVTVATATYSYKVKSGDKAPGINTSKYITTNNDGETGEKLVKMTFGGWRWNKGTYTRPETKKDITDSWTASETEAAGVTALDGFNYWFRGTQDAKHEKKDSTSTMYGETRYGWFVSPKRENGITTDSYPYTLPVRGSFMTFEPTKNGTLTIYILQNGAWNTFDKDTQLDGVSYKKGDIKPGEFRMHAFQITNQRGLVLAEFAPKYSVTNNQKVEAGYSCTKCLDSEKPSTFDKTSKDVSDWEEFWALTQAERQAVKENWSVESNGGCQEIIKLDNGSFLAIQKAVVKYQFHVTGNETYYLFSNFSKMGFSGATFQPDAKQPTDETTFSGDKSLDDTKAYTPIKMESDGTTIGETGLTNYKYTINGEEVGKVDGVFIPQFKKITLKRTFKPNQWTTLSLPFNLTQTEVEQIFGTGTQIIVFDKAVTTTARIYLTFFYHEIQNVLPGYPYLIRPTLKYDTNNSNSAVNAPTHTIDGGNLTEFTVFNKAINPAIKPHEFKSGGYTAKCTPSYCTANENGNYSKRYEEGDIFVSEGNGTVYISEGKSYGKGYRSYIDKDKTGTTTTTAKALSISFSGVEDGDDNGTTTEIRVTELADDVIQTLGIGGVYNLNGQKVADTTRNLPAGIYIVNGRKVVVK